VHQNLQSAKKEMGPQRGSTGAVGIGLEGRYGADQHRRPWKQARIWPEPGSGSSRTDRCDRMRTSFEAVMRTVPGGINSRHFERSERRSFGGAHYKAKPGVKPSNYDSGGSRRPDFFYEFLFLP